MEIIVILGIMALAILFAKREQTPDAKRMEAMEERLSEMGEQVADYILDKE